MFKNKFESINYYKNVDVGIDVTSICNYKCWYCNSHYAKQYQNTILTLKTLDIIIHHLKIINKNYNIYLLGGEPLLHPHLKDIINKLNEFTSIDKKTIDKQIMENNEDCYVLYEERDKLLHIVK